MAKRLPKRVRDLMQSHRLSPGFITQREVMKRLKLGRNYQKFYSWFYRATVEKD